MQDEREDTTIYKVVVNHEEQYSLWPVNKANALGWNDVGKSGTKDECLAYIKEVWTDMRPVSLRKRMQEQGYGVANRRRRFVAPSCGLYRPLCRGSTSV